MPIHETARCFDKIHAVRNETGRQDGDGHDFGRPSPKYRLRGQETGATYARSALRTITVRRVTPTLPATIKEHARQMVVIDQGATREVAIICRRAKRR